MKKKKLTKILFLCSLSSFVITLILEFSQRYNQILFILRHSTLYLGIAFLVSAVVSYFYSIYKRYFIKKQINFFYLNIPTLIVLLVALIWIADTRLDFIAENEVPHYTNEILYDEHNNKIYESILVGIEPVVELIEKTDNTLVIHIEEKCECKQNSHYIEELHPNSELERYIDGSVEIVVDIIVLYNDDSSIDSYTIEETRLITYKPDGLSKHYGYVSRKLEVFNEYNLDNFRATQNSYYLAKIMTEQEFADTPIINHHDFTYDQASQSIVTVYRTLDDTNSEIYIMEVLEEDADVNELAILRRSETNSNKVVISFEESPNRNVPEFVWSTQSVKSEVSGRFIIDDSRIRYEQSYNEANVERGAGSHEILKEFDYSNDKYTLSTNDHTIDGNDHSNTGISKYGDIFSSTEYIEIVKRPKYALEDILYPENPFEINNINLYQIDKDDFGYTVSHFIDSSPYDPFKTHENSNLMLSDEFESPINGYFGYSSMLFQGTYFPTMIYENNEMLNFITQE